MKHTQGPWRKGNKSDSIVSFRCNLAIFVFDLEKIIYGYESWWGIIKSEKDLKQITNQDIDNVWYVKALKELCEEENK